MNEQHADQPRGSLARWFWRAVYVISPATVTVLLFIMGSGGAAREGEIFGWFCCLFVWIVFVTLLLIFKWRDSVFLAWGAPLGLALLVWMFITACGAYPLNTPHRVLEVPFEAYVLVIVAAAQFLGFVAGILGSILRLCSWGRSRVVESKRRETTMKGLR